MNIFSQILVPLVIGFLQPYLYKWNADVLAIVQRRKPQWFEEDGSIHVSPDLAAQFVATVIKAVLELIQKKH